MMDDAEYYSSTLEEQIAEDERWYVDFADLWAQHYLGDPDEGIAA